MMRFPGKQRGVIYPFMPAAWASSGEANAVDPHFSSVVNLSHFDGSNASTTFVDSSSHATNIPALGTGKLTTSLSKFGSASLNCPAGPNGAGSTGAALYGIGTSDYTVEFWAYTTSLSSAQNTVFWDDSAGNNGFSIVASTGKPRFWLNGVSHDGGTAITINTWHFLAYSRTGSSGILYLDGVSQVSVTDSVNHTSDTLYVGCYSGGSGLVGAIDDFRFTIGVGRYPSSCPVPTSPFPNH